MSKSAMNKSAIIVVPAAIAALLLAAWIGGQSGGQEGAGQRDGSGSGRIGGKKSRASYITGAVIPVDGGLRRYQF